MGAAPSSTASTISATSSLTSTSRPVSTTVAPTTTRASTTSVLSTLATSTRTTSTSSVNPSNPATIAGSGTCQYAGTYKYIGCYTDPDANARSLRGLYQTDGKTASRESCAQYCTSNQYEIFGIEAGYQCFCGHRTWNGAFVAESQCAIPCQLNSNEICGAVSALSLYELNGVYNSVSQYPSTPTLSCSSSSSTTSSATATGTPVKNSGRRGLGFNNPQLTQPFSLSNQTSKVSWAYNWASDPYYPAGSWTAGTFNKVLTYIPMLWSAADDLTSIWNTNVNNAISTYGADSVLSFNEPDGCCWSCGNSCMNVSSAVSAYKKWVQPFAGKVALGAPAVTNGVGSGVGIDYLSQFMGNCTGCTVDFIPLHWYGSVLDPGSFESYVQSFYTKFGKPIWITEFGTTSGTQDQIVSFLKSALPWLDSQSYVKRYAYFMDNNDGVPHLLYPNNSMTAIGTTFNSG